MQDSWQTILGAALVFAAYAISIWRIIRSNQGDRFIEFGSLTLLGFLLLLWVKKIPGTPGWVFGSLAALMYSLCLLALIFMFQQIYRAIRKRADKAP
jgi:hypothetical protein